MDRPPHRFVTFLARPLSLLQGYRPSNLPPDLLAGATVAAVAIPQAMAYAAMAELPPQAGLYSAGVAAIVGALWGSSRYLATGPVNATSLLVLPLLLATGEPGSPRYLLAASLLALLKGGLCVVLALSRAGALASLVSREVLAGFTAGAAVHIAAGQLRHLRGVEVPVTPALHQAVAELAARAGAWHPPTLALGLAALALLVGLHRLGPRIPAALLALCATAGAVFWLGLEQRGVPVVGSFPGSLPVPTWVTAPVWPSMELVRSLMVGTMAVTGLGLVEAVAAAQTFSRRAGERLDSDQEIFGQGLANLAAGLLSGFPCSGSLTRTSLAHLAGARSRLAGVFTGGMVLLGVLLLAPLARFIPRSAIAAVLLFVAWGMVDTATLRRILRTSRGEAAVTAVTFSATLVLPLDFAVLAGIVSALAYFIILSSLPRVFPVVPDARFEHLVHCREMPECPQLAVLNIRGPLFFGAVYHLEQELRHHHEEHPGQHFLMLRMHGVEICDLTGIEMLEETVRTYRALGGDVFLVRLRQPVQEIMEQTGFLPQTLDRDHILQASEAIEVLFARVLDPAVCTYECEHRVFAECQALTKHAYPGEVPPASLPLRPGPRDLPPRQFMEQARVPGALLFDLREPEEYARGHLHGARLLPLRELPASLGRLPRDRLLLFSCRSGRRSSRALVMLAENGFAQLHCIRGGILAWRAAGLPLSGPEPGEPQLWGGEEG